MDALSEILEHIKLRAVVYQKLEMASPWGVEMAQDNCSQFWRLLKGHCLLKVPDHPIIEMQEGDLVMVPHGSTHWIANDEKSKKVPAAIFTKARLSGRQMFTKGAESATLIGGHFEFDAPHPFLSALPKVIHIRNFSAGAPYWLQQTAGMIFEEVSNDRPGSKIIIKRLGEVVFIHIMRTYLEQSDALSGFLLALKDERISKALKLMQDAPDKDWTLDNLAKSIGMSRTLFFNNFKYMVGETPLSYLTNWRIIKAREILTISKENISEIAVSVGYQSEAAFNRIFKSKVGQTPANYRRAKLVGNK